MSKTPKTLVYELGREYPILPFGPGVIVDDQLKKGRFVGYLQPKWGYPTSSTLKWPVFETVQWGNPILFALDNGRCAARGKDVAALMADFTDNHQFWGSKHEVIQIEKGVTLPKADFVKQMNAAGIETAKLEESLMHGRYLRQRFNHGEIKWCDRCLAMRQTSCGSGCGCGNCHTCNRRWICNPGPGLIPDLMQSPMLPGSGFYPIITGEFKPVSSRVSVLPPDAT